MTKLAAAIYRDGSGNLVREPTGGFAVDNLAGKMSMELTAADVTRARLDSVMGEIMAANRGGERTEELRKEREHPAGLFERVYSYWLMTLFAIRGRPFPFIPVIIYLAYCSAVISFALYYLDPRGELKTLQGYKPEMKDVVAILGLAVFFVLSFRSNNAYARWYDGASRFFDICSLVNNGARQIAAITPTHEAIELLWWLFAALFAAKQQLRGLTSPSDYDLLRRVLPPSMWDELADRRDKFHWALYCYHRVATRINYGITTEDRGCQEVMRITIPMVDKYGSCWRILRTPMPFAYLTHLRVFLVGWLAILPWCFAISYDWWTLLLCAFAGAGLLGIEEAATEIEQPFGSDCNDLPLDYMAANSFQLVSEFILHVGFDDEGHSLDGKSVGAICLESGKLEGSVDNC